MKMSLSDSREQFDSREMMKHRNKRPYHRKLKLLLVLMPGLLWLDHMALFSNLEHRAVQIMIVLLVYGLMFYWAKNDDV